MRRALPVSSWRLQHDSAATGQTTATGACSRRQNPFKNRYPSEPVIAWFGLGITVLGVLYGLAQVRAYLTERHFLRTTLVRLSNGGGFRNVEDLIRLKHYLSTHIRYDAKRVNEARPLLRHSAEHIL